MRIISWSRVKLDTFFKDRPDVELQLDHSLGADLTRLLGNDRVAQNANPVDLDLSPGFIQRGGFCTKATPSGLPVEITSPALSGVHHSHENHREFFLTRLKGQCHFCDAAGDVETLATFDAERLQ